MGLPMDKLSPPAREAVRTLATVASQLHLARPSHAAIVAAWTDLALREMRAAMSLVGRAAKWHVPHCITFPSMQTPTHGTNSPSIHDALPVWFARACSLHGTSI